MLEEAADRALVKITDLGSVLRDPYEAMQESMAMDGAELVAMCASCKRVRADDGLVTPLDRARQAGAVNDVKAGRAPILEGPAEDRAVKFGGRSDLWHRIFF